MLKLYYNNIILLYIIYADIYFIFIKIKYRQHILKLYIHLHVEDRETVCVYYLVNGRGRKKKEVIE